MGWDVADAAEIVQKYAADYFRWFLDVLRRPTIIGSVDKNIVFIYLVFSALIGGTLGAVIPGRPPLKDRATIAVVVLVLWVFTALLIHVVCRLMRGQGTLEQTILAMVQILAIAYVTSTFVALLLSAARATYPGLANFLSHTGLEKPGDVILFVQFLLLALYTPFILKAVHKYQGAFFGSVVGLLAAGIAALIAFPIIVLGGC